MEPRIAVPAPVAGLKVADKQIDAIIQNHLPLTPHLLSVPTTKPYPIDFPYENKNTSAAHLFEEWEVRRLQYMTLVSHGDRGVGLAQGNWEDEINALSPHSMGVRSSTTTPNPHKQPKVKISMADYKKVKKGEMVMPKRSASPPEMKKQEGQQRKQERQVEASSIRVIDAGKPRAAAVEDKRNGLGPALHMSKPELKPAGRDQKGRTPAPQATRPDPKAGDKAVPRTNGHVDRPAPDHPKPKDNISARPSPKLDPTQKSKEAAKQNTSTRPQASSTNIWDMKKKRPLDSPARDALHPEKRTKTDTSHARTPSGSQNLTPNRTGTPSSDSKASPFKHGHSRSTSNLSRVSPSQALPQLKKAAPKRTDSKPQPSKPSPQKPVNSVPPLLSPLHPDIGGSDDVVFFASTHLKSDDHTPPKTPKKAAGGDEKRTSTNDSPLSSPLSTPPKSQSSNTLPPPLSPMLPDILEQELAKLQQKSAQASVITVDARHEKARLPDAPGVARKTVIPKIGHPPKKERHSDASQKSRELNEKNTLILKLPYKKRQARDIERMLALKPTPSKEFKRREAQKLEAERQRREPAAKPAFNENSSDDDTPIAVIAKPPLAKKRPSSEQVQSTPKRTKLPENLDVTKASVPVTPAFKSPTLIGPHKSLLATPTPKKGDAIKGVLGGAAMRRVDSSDGHAHTPQTSTSNPASAEKPRVTNGDQRPRHDEIGLKLKRKMDAILKTKEAGGIDSISDSDRKLGACVGLECVSAYMQNAYFASRNDKNLGRPRQSMHWEGVFALWTFLERLCRINKIPVMHALAMQIGAVCSEELNGIYIEGRDGKLWDSWKKREGIWAGAHRERGVLLELCSAKETLGPWSSVSDATTFAYGVIGAFAKREKLDWKRED